MGNYEQLKQSVSDVIKTNGNQEITGSILQNVLLTIISSVGANATFAGLATPATNPGTPDGPVFYLAFESGTYSNFNAIELQDGLSVLMWNSSWSSQQIFSIDDEPTAGSDNLVKSGGVAEELALGAVYDVSAKNPTAGVNNDGKWESLSALLSDANLSTLIPTHVRKGGMSIKFVQSSDNKYVQFRLMAQNFTTDVSQWQSENVTDKPVYKGKDLVSSGGIYDAIPLEGYAHPKTDINLDIADPKGNVIVRFSKGNIKTLKFDSESTPAQIPENNDKELQISDSQGCVIAEFEGGDFKTKNFDSRSVALSEEEPSNDFGVADPQGFILLRCKNGGIRTQKFNSKAITDKIDIAPSSYLRDINEVISVNEDISCSSVEKFDLPFTDMTEKWVGGILAPNGKITCIPNSGTQIAEIDPATNQISLYGNLPQGKFKWSGGTLGSDGLIYCSPRSSNRILVINPETRKYELKDMSITYNFNDHHYGGVVVGMKMYLAPNGSKDILVVDLIKGTTVNIGNVDVSYSYCAILYHPNGYIYMFPYQMGKVIKINPQNDTWEYVGDALKVSCYGLAINPVDNCVYGFSAYVKGIYKFDPSTNTSSWLKTDEINFNENGGNWYGTVLGMNGKIYSMPGWCNWVYEYDIANDSLRLITTLPNDAGSATARTAGGVLSSDGTIWAVCAIKRYFYKFNFEGIKRTFPMNELSSVYFKNY